MRHFVKLDGALGQDVIHAFLEADARPHFTGEGVLPQEERGARRAHALRGSGTQSAPRLRDVRSAYESTFELKVGDVEWEAYLKALEIRDRLTHLKKPADIKVSDDEYSKVLHVTRTWFARNFNEALDGLLSAQAKRTGGARIEIALDGEPSEEGEPSS
jgi:hypothetical protein